MPTKADAAEIEEVWRTLASLGYCDPSVEDIDLTLKQVGEARSRAALQSSQLLSQKNMKEESFHQVSASPPRGANDMTMLPHDNAGDDDYDTNNNNNNNNNNNKDEYNDEGQEFSDDRNRRCTSTSLKQWPGLSSHSIRGGRTTPMNSTGTGHHNRRGRLTESQVTRDYQHQIPYNSRGSVVVEGRAHKMGGERYNNKKQRNNIEVPHVNRASCGSNKGGVTIPTANGVVGLRRGNESFVRSAQYLNPQARLERHLKRYERVLKAFYVNRYDNDDDNEYDGEDEDAEYDDDDDNNNENEDYYENEYYDIVERKGHGNELSMNYGSYPKHNFTPEMPLRISRSGLNQRSANTIYNFTGDSRYKYRGGSGVPLCAVLGPNGSTLRQRADPVRRGQQMRELWKKDKFLAQQGRKEDRWKVRQCMLALDS